MAIFLTIVEITPTIGSPALNFLVELNTEKHYFFFKYKKSLIIHLGLLIAKNSFVAEVTFKEI